jgi:ribosomal protein S12 methylthiotransferase accessory factor
MAPRIEIEPHRVLHDAPFALVEARIDWGDGRCSQGWGRDPSFQVAVDKATCEAVERFAYRHLPAARWAAMHELASCIDPRTIIRHAPWQYRGAGDGTGAWPSPFDPDEVRCWLAASSVLGGDDAWVLADCVCNPRAFDASYRRRLLTHATTSGCASAFDIGDAILRAALELIERDAMMRHWFAQAGGHHIVPNTLPSGIRVRLRRLHEAGCDAGIQCLTMGVHPAWLVWARHDGLRFTSVGSASGLDAVESLDTAMREMETQALARLDGVPPVDVRAEDVTTAADHAAIYATEHYYRRADALWEIAGPTAAFDTLVQRFAIDAQALYGRAAAAGHPLSWVDLGVPQARGALAGRTVHTVRALAPELIPLCFGRAQAPLGMDRWHRGDPTALHPFS